jgi:hypothetical protein
MEAHGYATVRKNHSKDKFLMRYEKFGLYAIKEERFEVFNRCSTMATDYNMRIKITEMIMRSGG